MGVRAGLYMCDFVKKSSRSLSHLLMSSCTFWYWLTRVVPEKGPVNGCCCCCCYCCTVLCLFLFPANPLLFWMSSHISLWSNILFYFAILINLIVAFFYPFSSAQAGVFQELSELITRLTFSRFVLDGFVDALSFSD